MSAPPQWQWDFIGYGPIVPSFFSVIGSSLIISHVLGAGREQKLQKPHLRLLLVMSLYDLACSLVFPWSWTMQPAGYGWDRARGNMSSCRAQGYFITLSTAVGAYNSLLCVYYYLTICRGVKPETWRPFERFFHVFIFITFNLLGAIGVGFKLFNPSLSGCFIASYPPACESYPFAPTCERVKPEDLRWMNYLFNRAWLIVYVVTVVSCNFMIWRKVKVQHQRADRVDAGTAVRASRTASVRADASDPRAQRERMVFLQCLLFTVAFFISQSGPLMFLISEEAGYLEFWQAAMTIVLWPTQGFFNAIIFGRPIFNSVRKKYPGITVWQAFQQTFFAADPLKLNPSIAASLTDLKNNTNGTSSGDKTASDKTKSGTSRQDSGTSVDESNGKALKHSDTAPTSALEVHQEGEEEDYDAMNVHQESFEQEPPEEEGQEE